MASAAASAPFGGAGLVCGGGGIMQISEPITGAVALVHSTTPSSSSSTAVAAAASAAATGGSSSYMPLVSGTPAVTATTAPNVEPCRFPKLEECAHFHYERVKLPKLHITLQLNGSSHHQAFHHNHYHHQGSSYASTSQCIDHDDDCMGSLTVGALSSLHNAQQQWFMVQVTSGDECWLLQRNLDNFRMLDAQLHQCIYDRKIFQLADLSQLSTDDETLPERLKNYLERFSTIADNSINCGPVLNWLQMDNKGHRLLVPSEESRSINTPAVAAAYSVRKYVSQACDELNLEVGDMISVIDMANPAESMWWRGKRGFQVGFFPQHCVHIIGDKVPRHMPVPPPVVGHVAAAALSPVKPVLRRHGKLITFFRSFILNRPSRRKLKQSGILRERVFGCDLGEHLSNAGTDVPTVLKCCAEFIERNGIVDGIYRLSGVTSNIQKLRNAFDEDRIPDLYVDDILQDIHSVASLLKMYFRELPNPLCTYQLYQSFVNAVQGSSTVRNAECDRDRLLKMRDAVQKLPPPHYRTLEYLMRHLAKVAQHGSRTGMTTRNIAIVWAPNLLRCAELEVGGVAALQGVGVQAVVTEFLIYYAHIIFNTESPRFGCGRELLSLDATVLSSSSSQSDKNHSTISPSSSQRRCRPKSLAVSTPTKLITLEEAQRHKKQQQQQQKLSMDRVTAPMLNDNTGGYIEVGGGPKNLPKKYHTIIELPSRKRARRHNSSSKRSPLGWRSLFSSSHHNNGTAINSSTSSMRRSIGQISHPLPMETTTTPTTSSSAPSHDHALLNAIQWKLRSKSVESLTEDNVDDDIVVGNVVGTPKMAPHKMLIKTVAATAANGHNRSVSHDSYFDQLSELNGQLSSNTNSKEGSLSLLLDLSEIQLNFDSEESEMRIFSDEDGDSALCSPRMRHRDSGFGVHPLSKESPPLSSVAIGPTRRTLLATNLASRSKLAAENCTIAAANTNNTTTTNSTKPHCVSSPSGPSAASSPSVSSSTHCQSLHHPSPKKQPRMLFSPSSQSPQSVASSSSISNNSTTRKRTRLEDQLSDIQFIDCASSPDLPPPPPPTSSIANNLNNCNNNRKSTAAATSITMAEVHATPSGTTNRQHAPMTHRPPNINVNAINGSINNNNSSTNSSGSGSSVASPVTQDGENDAAAPVAIAYDCLVNNNSTPSTPKYENILTTIQITYKSPPTTPSSFRTASRTENGHDTTTSMTHVYENVLFDDGHGDVPRNHEQAALPCQQAQHSYTSGDDHLSHMLSLHVNTTMDQTPSPLTDQTMMSAVSMRCHHPVTMSSSCSPGEQSDLMLDEDVAIYENVESPASATAPIPPFLQQSINSSHTNESLLMAIGSISSDNDEDVSEFVEYNEHDGDEDDDDGYEDENADCARRANGGRSQSATAITGSEDSLLAITDVTPTVSPMLCCNNEAADTDQQHPTLGIETLRRSVSEVNALLDANSCCSPPDTPTNSDHVNQQPHLSNDDGHTTFDSLENGTVMGGECIAVVTRRDTDAKAMSVKDLRQKFELKSKANECAAGGALTHSKQKRCIFAATEGGGGGGGGGGLPPCVRMRNIRNQLKTRSLDEQEFYRSALCPAASTTSLLSNDVEMMAAVSGGQDETAVSTMPLIRRKSLDNGNLQAHDMVQDVSETFKEETATRRHHHRHYVIGMQYKTQSLPKQLNQPKILEGDDENVALLHCQHDERPDGVGCIDGKHQQSSALAVASLDEDLRMRRERIERYKEERRKFLQDKYRSESFKEDKDAILSELKIQHVSATATINKKLPSSTMAPDSLDLKPSGEPTTSRSERTIGFRLCGGNVGNVIANSSSFSSTSSSSATIQDTPNDVLHDRIKENTADVAASATTAALVVVANSNSNNRRDAVVSTRVASPSSYNIKDMKAIFESKAKP